MKFELLHTARLISLESKTPSFNATKILSKFPEFFSGVLDSVNATVHGISKLTSKEPAANEGFLEALKAHPYTSLMDVKVYTPQGMQGTYIAYLDKLEKSVDYALAIPDKVVVPFERWCADMLANPSRLASVNPNKTLWSAADLLKVSDPSIQSSLDAIVGSDETKGPHLSPTEALYKQVIERNTDWTILFARLEALDKKIVHSTVEKTQKTLEDVGEVLVKLLKNVSEDPATYATSGAQMQVLSSTIIEVAHYVEWYAAILYLFGYFQKAVYDSRDAVKAQW